MPTTVEGSPNKLIVLDEEDVDLAESLGPGSVTVCRSPADLDRITADWRRYSVWLSHSPALTDELLKRLAGRSGVSGHPLLLLLQPPRVGSIPSLCGLFQPIGMAPSYRWLPTDELLDVLRDTARKKHLLIGGAADRESETLALVRGDFSTLVVPFDQFPPGGDGTLPDFDRLAFTDHGHTVRLGDYEAAADAILYEADPEYRRALQKERRATERSFGAALRRLRKQRGLRQRDFAPLPARTIARIERSEVRKPRGETLKLIAERLGVEPEEIGSY